MATPLQTETHHSDRPHGRDLRQLWSEPVNHSPRWRNNPRQNNEHNIRCPWMTGQHLTKIKSNTADYELL